jgi:spermidine synthase
MDGVARVSALASAFLAGAAGLGLQSVLVSASGLALGYGGSVAIGLAVWLAAWAVGAGLARRPRVGTGRALLVAGAALLCAAPASAWALLCAGRTLAGGPWAIVIAITALALPALLQGVFLPVLARGFERVGWLFTFNLLGCLCGAYAVGDRAVGALGRMPAAWIAGAIALLAGLLGAHAARASSTPAPESADTTRTLSPGRALLVVALGTAWMSALEWISFRLGVLWLGGMQNALNAVLCASLVGLCLGAALLSPVCARRRHGLTIVLLACAAGSAWPFCAGLPLGLASGAPIFVKALILCVPTLFAFGALVPVVHASARGGADAGERLGGLLASETAGALLGIPLVHFVVVPHHGLAGAIAFALVLGTIALFLVSRVAWIPAALLALFAGFRPTPALDSAPYANPALSILSVREDRDFAVGVVDDGMLGERTLLTDGFRAAGTGRDYLYMQALGHLPLLLHPAPKRVAVLALGTGTTVGAVSLHDEVERIDVLEISRAVVEAAPFFVEKNHGALAEGLPGLVDDKDGVARVVVKLGDGRATLARSPEAYDVITMEPLLPDSPFAVYLYTAEFYAIAKRALKPGGLVCQWVPPHALEPATFQATCRAFTASFAWTGTWLFGTQVVLVGGEARPRLDAARFGRGSPAGLAELANLGLATPSALASRWCGNGLAGDRAARELTDEDPWVVYCPRRSGARLLLDLPLNLASIERASAGASSPFADELGPEGLSAAAGQRALRSARAAHAFREAELRGAPSAESTGLDFEEQLLSARTLLDGDPEITRFEDEVRFLADVRTGVSALASSSERSSAEAALEPLISAVERRRERADVHLYAAVALDRLGSPAAEKALAEALRRCPRIARTPEGHIARTLTMSPAMWHKVALAAGFTD